MNGKLWYWIGAVGFFLAGFYEAYRQDFMPMWVLFVGMTICLGIALRGRNTWMQ